jgi:DNA polymerase III psi subunit
MIKHTQHFLDKLVNILAQNNYSVRNEKGNFKSGHCLKEQSRVILLNKNAPIESRVNFLCDVLRSVEVDESLYHGEEKKLIEYLKQTELKL